MKLKLILGILLAAVLTMAVANAQSYSVDYGFSMPTATGLYMRESNIFNYEFTTGFTPGGVEGDREFVLRVDADGDPSLKAANTIQIEVVGTPTDLFTAYPGTTTRDVGGGVWEISLDAIYDGSCINAATHITTGSPCSTETFLIPDYAALDNSMTDGATLDISLREQVFSTHTLTGSEETSATGIIASNEGMIFTSTGFDVWIDTDNDNIFDAFQGSGGLTGTIGYNYYMFPNDSYDHFIMFNTTASFLVLPLPLANANLTAGQNFIVEDFNTSLVKFAAANNANFQMRMGIAKGEFASGYFCDYAAANTSSKIEPSNCGGAGTPDTVTSITSINGTDYFLSDILVQGSGGGGNPAAVPEFSDLGWILAAVLGGGGFILMRRKRNHF